MSSPFDFAPSGSRRAFLQAGIGLGALSLADLLRAEAQSGIGASQKAVINIHLDGGPPHQDMIDLKPDAPVEIRGEFQPIATNISGISISELLPRLATIADKLVFVRSLVGSAGAHDAFQCQSGFLAKDLQPMGGRPAMGCVLSKLLGSTADIAPSFVDLMQGRPLVRNSARPGFLGPSYQPFRPDLSALFRRELEPGMVNELARRGENHAVSLALNPALTADRLTNRTGLLGELDRYRREVDASGMMDAMDRFTQQAVGILTSGRFAEALDLSREDPQMLARYTPQATGGDPGGTSDEPIAARKLLLARRLIEAGVRCVSVSFSDFDTHRGNFRRLRSLLPIVDHAIHALVTDLEERGRLQDVSIVAWGEFGRTPKINSSDGGRDHWPGVGMALLAGGGMRTGQVIGSTDRLAAVVRSRPVHYQDVFATLYHNLGLDLSQVRLTDLTGRPQHVLDRGEVLREVA